MVIALVLLLLLELLVLLAEIAEVTPYATAVSTLAASGSDTLLPTSIHCRASHAVNLFARSVDGGDAIGSAGGGRLLLLLELLLLLLVVVASPKKL